MLLWRVVGQGELAEAFHDQFQGASHAVVGRGYSGWLVVVDVVALLEALP